MYRRTLVLMSLLAGTGTAGMSAQAPTYPPFSEYAMLRDAELQLVRTAAPSTITDRATLKVLTQSGYQVAREGDNGFTCFVMRGWTAPTYTPKEFVSFTYDATIRGTICFDPIASRTSVKRSLSGASTLRPVICSSLMIAVPQRRSVSRSVGAPSPTSKFASSDSSTSS